ncbi:MAG: phosphatidylserine decarboxylase [Niabella sp.]|nr:phosphatidylserine decarboxylase [Niabella sp.]
MKRSILILVMLIHNFFINAQTDCLPVIKLKSIYAGNHNFRQLIDSMFLNVQPLPDGSQNFWDGKNINSLYTFLNEWFFRLPTQTNGLEDILKFSELYYHNSYGLRFVNEEPGLDWTLYFVKEQGKFMDSPQSAGSIPLWLSDSTLHNNEYVIPAKGYQSFNQFFTRDLKPGMRPVARAGDESVIVSPVDGTIVSLDVDLKPDSALPIKGRTKLSLGQLLGNSGFAPHFIGGSALSILLLPRNYHHFHAPVSGQLVESNSDVGSILFGSQIADFFMTGKTDFSVFENYKHGYFIFKTKQYGYIALIPVGLETVGSVVFEDRVKNIDNKKTVMVAKGEKLGHFAYGGSMVLLLFEKNRMTSLTVQQGQQIGVLNP